ncbi:MAG TPA: DUF2851 family protein [Chitinophagaceae bacterium]|nr:DUF2851 family protein [Chitinophagaceae bacterium]
MYEKLLQFIWHHQYFNVWDLRTVSGEPLSLICSGTWNKNQGPDFLSARIRTGEQEWAGNIELHVRSSDWDLHGHADDPNYANVILHVVWEHDRDIANPMPVLELRHRVPPHLLQKYRSWMMNDSMIPCSGEIGSVDRKMAYAWLEWLTLQRMKTRSAKILEKVITLGMDWEEGFWRLLARAFGHKVNSDAFESIAATLPVKLMMRHRNNSMQLEALLLGQAGLLRTDNGDDYAKALFREYGFLRKKYQLVKSYMPVHFLRMRPGNFPTLRLAQLAALVSRNPDLFRGLLDLGNTNEMKAFLRVEAGGYWDHHYRFGEGSVFLKKQTGEQFIENIIFNTIIPFLAAYHQHQGNGPGTDRLFQFMEGLNAESNSVIRNFERLGFSARHAGDSQALLELKHNYCDQFMCLECAIGKSLLKNSSMLKLQHF